VTIDRARCGFRHEGYGTKGNDTPLNPAYLFYRELPQRDADIAAAAACWRSAATATASRRR
jgi:peptide/nickel transport system substrate-binding protein